MQERDVLGQMRCKHFSYVVLQHGYLEWEMVTSSGSGMVSNIFINAF